MVAQLLEAAVSSARGAPVTMLRIRHASTVPEDVLRQAFEMLTAGGPLAGASLETEQFEIHLACPCGFEGSLEHDDVITPGLAVCPTCRSLRAFPPRPPLELLEVCVAT
jgi:Zn finger protein HypA/HybF involved in hydrogenase expression